jgi:hypothetical protein
MRIAKRYLLITVPREQDLTLGQVECQVCHTRFNPDYHLRSFDRQKMSQLLGGTNFTPQHIAAFGEGVEYAGSRLITRLKSSRENRFPQDLPCPACGNILPGKSGVSMVPITQGGGGWRSTIKALWPKRHEERWLIGLYARAITGPC